MRVRITWKLINKMQNPSFPLAQLALMLALLFTVSASHAEPALPYQDGHLHEGVATCAGSACHGSSQTQSNTNVLQNEYFIWTREDRHAQAYKTLLNAQSKKIGQRLGLSPEKSARCLACHSDYVPEDMRRRFRLSDGVTCEACHGGAQGWIKEHVDPTATHASNLAAGLFPTDQPLQRGRLCLSCHLGDKDHPIDHEIMGAGHPPLGFELDTFTAIEPAHHDLDEDYAQRKGIRTSAQTWADGQLIAAQRYLEELASPRLKQGLFPELVFFDCYACHHKLNDERWDVDTATGLGPGRVRLHGVNLILVEELLKVLEPSAVDGWVRQVRAVHAASQKDLASLQAAANSAAATVKTISAKHAGHSYSEKQAWDLIAGIIQRTLRTPDFNLAEQSNMAIEAVFLTLDRAGKISPSKSKAIRAALDQGYQYTNDAKDYSVSGYANILKKIQANAKP